MIVILHPEQAAEVKLLSKNLGLPEEEVVRHLLSGPLMAMDTSPDPVAVPA